MYSLSPMAPDVECFTAAAGELGFTEHGTSGIASQVIVRLLIQTGRPLSHLTTGPAPTVVTALRRPG
jgi:hypothetical protein